MNQVSRVAAGALLVTALGVRATSTAAQTPAAVQPPQIIEQVLVRVNGDIITKSDLEERQISALRQRNVDPDKLTDEQLRKALADVTPQIVVNAIEELLLTQLGREKGLRLSDEMFNRWLANMRKEQNLEDDKRFQEALKQEGMTLTDVRRNVERQYLISEVQRDEFGGKLQITEDDARQYYKANQNEFTEPASVMLREIRLDVPTTTQGGEVGVNVAQDDAVAEKAKAVRARLTAGEDFAKVAGEVSAGATAANGGLIGPIAEQELSASLQQVLQKMKPGDITEPIKTAKGYQIIKLDSRKPPTVRPFESVRDLVADRVYQHRSRAEMRKFIDRVRRQAIIVWKNEELRKAYEQQLAAMGSADPGSGGL